MECDICSREQSSSNEPLCVSCARSTIYLARLEVARILLEKETLSKQVRAIIEPLAGTSQSGKDVVQAQTFWRADAAQAEKISIKTRIDETKSHITSVKQEMDIMRNEISQRKAALASRRDTLHTIAQVMPIREQNKIEPISTQKDEHTRSFHNVHNRSTKTRAFLCREAATLLRLRQKKKLKSGVVKEQYMITGTVLPNLRDINNARCSDLSAALMSMAHLLVLTSFYLGIRLPAEVTTPHPDYPMPTINTPASSYLGPKVAFPGSGSSSITPSSPFFLKHETKTISRPRPLFIGSEDVEEKVAQFAKREPTGFNFFVEGISLLAWNIAWLTRTQGYSAGTTSWDDICDMGRNMWQLTRSSTQSPALLRVLSTRDAQRRANSPDNLTSTSISSEPKPISLGRLGQTSHLSTHSFLGQAEYLEYTRVWKYSQWNVISDSLKKHLLTEMNNAEWEMLEEQEWDDGGEQFEEAVFVKARNMGGHDFDDARSIMTTRTQLEDTLVPETGTVEGNKPKGVSGWTKLKTRDKDKQ